MKSRINKIEYIVQGNPEMVTDMLSTAGFQVQDDLAELAEAAKEWVRLDGKEAIKELLKAHPDASLLLQSTQEHEDEFCGCEASYSGGGCGCQSSYSGEISELDFLTELSGLSYQELKQQYLELKKLVAINPNDLDLKQELEATWSMLSPEVELEEELPDEEIERSTQKDKKAQEGFQCTITKKDLLFGGAIIGLAFLVSRI
jgi:hypothetical protein